MRQAIDKEQRLLQSQSDPAGLRVEFPGTPHGFALLAAAPENGWSCGCFQDWSPPDRFPTHDPYPCSLSFINQQYATLPRQVQ